MIFYEVNIEMEASYRNELLAWLEEHVKEVLALNYFKTAQILELINQEKNDQCTFRITYTTSSMERLQEYFQKDAPAMRTKGVEKFGDKMKSFRRIFKEV